MQRDPGCSYIYTDGTLVSIFEEKRRGVQVGETAEVTFGYCKLTVAKRDCDNRWREVGGRIVVHQRYNNTGFVALAKGGAITASMPALSNGSENTQKRGIDVQYLSLMTKQGYRLDWTETPGIMCAQFTIQDGADYANRMEQLYVGALWGCSARIIKVSNLGGKAVAA